jgi:hypothetical protein
MSDPSYAEIYAEVLDKVQHTAIGDRPSEQQHEHALDIMDALEEAYSLGHYNGAMWMATAVTDGSPEDRMTNPYERPTDVPNP